MRVSDMRTRTHTLFVVLASLMLGALGSLVAVGSTIDTADACSLAAPHIEIRPGGELEPGQKIEIAGWGFLDYGWHEDEQTDPGLCNFEAFPLTGLDVVWHGNVSERLGVVDGHEFVLGTYVPNAATHGPAMISVREVMVEVVVGPTIAPPPQPCPLVADAQGAASHQCPWPCPVPQGAAETQPAPGHAPGLLPPCFDPCVDYAHTAANGTQYEYRWDCPDPCASPAVAPGAAVQPGVWCPPPDPCFYGDTAGTGPNQNRPQDGCPPCEVVGGDAVWCPPEPCVSSIAFAAGGAPSATQDCPREPCVVYLHGDTRPVEPGEKCPDPCALVGGDAVWCPPPCDFPLYADGVPEGLAIDCPPEPCPVYLHGDVDAAQRCPDPCRVVDGDAIWCPPQPCDLVGGDAVVCPEPCPLIGGDAVAPNCPHPCDPNPWEPCPEPCPVYVTTGDQKPVETSPIYCPDPCQVVGGDAVWCPPIPLPAEPAPASTEGQPAPLDPPQTPPPPSETAADAEADAEADAAIAVAEPALPVLVQPVTAERTPERTTSSPYVMVVDNFMGWFYNLQTIQFAL